MSEKSNPRMWLRCVIGYRSLLRDTHFRKSRASGEAGRRKTNGPDGARSTTTPVPRGVTCVWCRPNRLPGRYASRTTSQLTGDRRCVTRCTRPTRSALSPILDRCTDGGAGHVQREGDLGGAQRVLRPVDGAQPLQRSLKVAPSRHRGSFRSCHRCPVLADARHAVAPFRLNIAIASMRHDFPQKNSSKSAALVRAAPATRGYDCGFCWRETHAFC